MANKTEQVLEATENINNREAFFMKYKKAILIAVAAIIVVIAGVFLYISQISGPREERQAQRSARVRPTSTTRCSSRLSMATVQAS